MELREAAHVDVQDEAHPGEHGDDRGAAVAEERQGDAGHRHDPHRHAHVLEHLEREHRQHADTHQYAEEIAPEPGPAVELRAWEIRTLKLGVKSSLGG